MTLDFLQEKLQDRIEKGNIRTLGGKAGLVDFVSNDYLGLSQNQELAKRIRERMDSEGAVPNGGTGSRLLSGNHRFYGAAEQYLQEVFSAESALIFNSGYAANQALVSAVAERGDTILYDQLSHVCLKEGAWLSRAETVSFLHNDLNDLEAKIKRAKGRVFVLTETVFSMDGDMAPLADLVEVCEQSNAYLIVDEAHSTGVMGPGGAGYMIQKNLHDRIFARVYTFGKGMGVHGACVAGSKILTDYLINFGRPFIYTTSLPPHSVLAIEESFRYLSEHLVLQDELEAKINLFRSRWEKSLSHTAIQPVMIGSNKKAREVSMSLQEAGLDVRPILSPTVQRGTERLRISLHVHNTDAEIIHLTDLLRELV